ncbi:MAG: DNA cytosine methyltransferase [Streptosporangiaceae bacterium]
MRQTSATCLPELSCGIVGLRGLLLENVRGLSLPGFAAYRQHVLDWLAELDYAADWRLLHAADYGVPQLRPRFVLIGDASRADGRQRLARCRRTGGKGQRNRPTIVGAHLRDDRQAAGLGRS